MVYVVERRLQRERGPMGPFLLADGEGGMIRRLRRLTPQGGRSHAARAARYSPRSFGSLRDPSAEPESNQRVRPQLPHPAHKKPPYKGGFFMCWRRGRDSNPRRAFNPYSLSRGALSTTQPPLRALRTDRSRALTLPVFAFRVY